MDVFVLERDPRYHDDCSFLVGVFSSMEKAVAASPPGTEWVSRGDTAYGRNEADYSEYSVTEYTVDVPGEKVG